jgi:hypothetical protein
VDPQGGAGTPCALPLPARRHPFIFGLLFVELMSWGMHLINHLRMPGRVDITFSDLRPDEPLDPRLRLLISGLLRLVVETALPGAKCLPIACVRLGNQLAEVGDQRPPESYALHRFVLTRCCTVSVGSLEVYLRKFFGGIYYEASSRSIRGQTTPQRISGA